MTEPPTVGHFCLGLISMVFAVQAAPGAHLKSTASVPALGPPAVEIPAGGDFAINAGLAGSWANADYPGQGIFIDVDPAGQVVFLAWFTYGDAAAGAGSVIGYPSNRWFVAIGDYAAGGNQVVMNLIETEGGVFDQLGGVTETEVGSLTLTFHGCTGLSMDFAFNAGPAGQFDLARLTPSDTCEMLISEDLE